MFPILKSQISKKVKIKENYYNNLEKSITISKIPDKMKHITKKEFFVRNPSNNLKLIEYINECILKIDNEIKINYCSRHISYISKKVFMNINVYKNFLNISFLGAINNTDSKIIDISNRSATLMNKKMKVYNKEYFDYLCTFKNNQHPEEYYKRIISSTSSMGVQYDKIHQKNGNFIIPGVAPLSQMIDFPTAITRLTGGHGSMIRKPNGFTGV